MKTLRVVPAVLLFGLLAAAVPASADVDYAQAADVAHAQERKPYQYGAAGPNTFDAPGLVQFSYKQIGVTVPRTARAQCSFGRPVDALNLRKGDVICYYNGSHVAIYYGDNKMVHAALVEGGPNTEEKHSVWVDPVEPGGQFRTYRP